MADLRDKGPHALNGLTAVAAAARIRTGEITSKQLVTDCLARIEAREGAVHAWAYLDPDYALEQASARDGEQPLGPLHGVPIGIKDILDTEDMPTGHGSEIYEGDRPGRDSACVAAFRKGGMVILGKTVTTEFASPYPAGTLNPHDPTRTPGVSSSGSAAAVADFMVPLANGTQTGGSVIGPSSSCGVYGYKASLDGLDRGAIRHLKPTLDTLGLFARSLDDIAALRAVSQARDHSDPLEILDGSTPRIGFCRSFGWDKASGEVKSLMETAREVLGTAGTEVAEFDLPQFIGEMDEDMAIISGVEGSRALAKESAEHLDTFNPWSRERFEAGSAVSEERYQRACTATAKGRELLTGAMADFDVLITPSAIGEAPQNLTGVRPSVFNRTWTHLYVPTVHLPLFSGPNQMPLGFQVIGPQHSDDKTIAFAAWIEQRIKDALSGLAR